MLLWNFIQKDRHKVGKKDEVLPKYLPNDFIQEREDNLKDVPCAKRGVFTHRFGAFDVHVVFREGKGSEEQTGFHDCNVSRTSRYRVYVPCMHFLSLGGFSVWCDSLLQEGCIRNEFHLAGKSHQYLHRQWFPNLALFCPFLTGAVPVSHSTQVEISYKVKKNHTDLGIQAMQRSGSMNVQEYVKRSVQACRIEAA